MDGRRFACLLIVLGLVGCQSAPPPAFPNWVPPIPEFSANAGSANAFDGYLLAAQRADLDAAKFEARVVFTPGMKDEAINKLGPALGMLNSAAGKPFEYKLPPGDPFQPRPGMAGWRLLGHALQWKIEKAVANHDGDSAVRSLILGTKFGFDLTGGPAAEASLGYAIVDDCRKAIMPILDKLGAKQLASLAGGVRRDLEAAPPESEMLERERRQMLAGVQAVQDAYQKNALEPLVKVMGGDVRPAITYLEDIRPKDSSLRPAYFAGLAQEADDETKRMSSLFEMAVAKRPKPEKAGDQPWRKLARQLFSAPRELLPFRDKTLARTRLLVLEAGILAMVKATGSAPKTLAAFPPNLRNDPYSGGDFVYKAEGSDYWLYSVGENLQDDGGRVEDEESSMPDLTLEGRHG